MKSYYEYNIADFQWLDWKLGVLKENEFYEGDKYYHSVLYALGPIRWTKKLRHEGE